MHFQAGAFALQAPACCCPWWPAPHRQTAQLGLQADERTALLRETIGVDEALSVRSAWVVRTSVPIPREQGWRRQILLSVRLCAEGCDLPAPARAAW